MGEDAALLATILRAHPVAQEHARTRPLTIGSLFSGIGGLELGLEMAGLGPVKWQVEISAPCRRILAAHWPEAKRYGDVRSIDPSRLDRVDLICGGFPCQDLSSAGKRAGLAGDRSGLWVEFARLVDGCRPKWVVVENVRSGASQWVDAVRRDLGQRGYATLPIPISASDLGAPHDRARVFLVGALADGDDVQRLPAAVEAGRRWARAPQSADLTTDPDGERGRARRPGRPARGDSRAPHEAPQSRAAYAHYQGQLQPGGGEREGGRWPGDADRIWTAEPAIPRVVHGLPGRVDRERALGNSVVPQCAEVIGHFIQRLR